LSCQSGRFTGLHIFSSSRIHCGVQSSESNKGIDDSKTLMIYRSGGLDPNGHRPDLLTGMLLFAEVLERTLTVHSDKHVI
ncbi:hypothetical protein MKX01_020632, partial [Papaver californicum]